MPNWNLSHGFDGEELAVTYLCSLGYGILDRNYRSGRWGELDIVCIEAGDLVFVEVKTRSSHRYGMPVEAMTPGKLSRIKHTAQHYKLTHPKTPDSLRFDVVTVFEGRHGQPEIVLYRNVTR